MTLCLARNSTGKVSYKNMDIFEKKMQENDGK